MEPITIEIQKMWNQYYPVPDFEVQRCRLFQTSLRVVLKDQQGNIEHQIEIPPGRLGEGVKSGFNRSIGSWRRGTDQEYEIILFNPADFTHSQKTAPRAKEF